MATFVLEARIPFSNSLQLRNFFFVATASPLRFASRCKCNFAIYSSEQYFQEAIRLFWNNEPFDEQPAVR